MAKIINRYDYDEHVARSPAVDFDPKKNKKAVSMTNQSDMDHADINKIIARFEQTGVIVDTSGIERKPVYGDFTGIGDYHGTLCAIKNVDRAFMALPASVRNKFDNDPQKLIDFCEKEENREEAVKLGLLSPKVETAKPEPSVGAPTEGPTTADPAGDKLPANEASNK